MSGAWQRILFGLALTVAAVCIVGGLMLVDVATDSEDALWAVWLELVGCGVLLLSLHAWIDLR